MALSILKNTLPTLTSSGGTNGKADIVLSSDNGKNKVVLPVVPAELPEITCPQNNETFNGVRGDMSVIGTLGLRFVTLDNYLLPASPDKYVFARPYGSKAADVINFLIKNQNDFIPIRIAITYEDGSVYLNMACLINNFSYQVDNLGDYHLKLDLTEYRMVNRSGGLSS